MKKILALLTCCAFLIGTLGMNAWGQCPTGEIEFTSQAQIDAFSTNYPGCTNISYNVYIYGPDITNVDGLSQLTSLTANLRIFNNPLLTNLDGLGNIHSAIVGLDIYNNASLIDLDGLEGIAITGGSLFIDENPVLVSIAGLSGITYVGGGLAISRNPLLASLAGLEGLNTVAGGFSINTNASLTSLAGLEGLTSVGLTFSVSNNPLLTNLIALGNLTSIAGPLIVSNNASLTSLSGLDNIAPASIANLFISSNPNLSFCEVASVCSYLSIPSNPANISGNTTGCNSRPEVEAACDLLFPIELLAFKGVEQGHGCLLSWRTASEHNNSHFEVEHSRNGVFFETVGMVQGYGNSSMEHEYDFLHRSPMPGMNYYRLKQYDMDGNFNYSPITEVDIAGDGAVHVYPNPVTEGSLRIALGKPLDGDKTLSILRADGLVVRMAVIPGDIAEQIVHIEDLRPGVYVLQLTGEDGVVFRQKIMKY